MTHSQILKYAAFTAFLAISVSLAAFPRYVSADTTTESTADKKQNIQQGAEVRNYGKAGSYLAARYARDNGDATAASYFFAHSLGHSPYDEGLMKQAVRTHVLAGRMDDAVRVAENLSALYDGTQLSHLVLLIDGLRNNKLDAARSHLESTEEYGLFSVVQPILKSWITFAQTGKPEEISVSEHLSKLQVFDGMLAFQNALILDVAGQPEKARSYYDQVAQDTHGMNYRAVLALLDFYRRQGDTAAVDALYERYQTENRSNPLTEGATKEQMLKEAQGENGAPMIANARDGVAEALFTLAGMLYGENVTAETQLYLQLALYLRPGMQEAMLMLGSIMEDRGDDDKAIAIFDAIAPQGPVYRRAQVRKAFLLAAQEKTGQAMSLLEDLQKRYPLSPDILISQGDIYRKQSRFDRAADAYTDALELSGKERTESQWPILFARGISYERDGEWDKAEADFKQALAIYPDQPDVLNYLGYSWLMQGTNLAKAKDMLEQAVAERPEDAHIIDSMGWALYMLGDYNGALKYLEQAVNMMPGDPVVNDHYGDVLWQLGRRNEARFQWERALHFGPEEDERGKIETKLKSGLAAKATSARISAAQN